MAGHHDRAVADKGLVSVRTRCTRFPSISRLMMPLKKRMLPDGPTSRTVTPWPITFSNGIGVCRTASTVGVQTRTVPRAVPHPTKRSNNRSLGAKLANVALNLAF